MVNRNISSNLLCATVVFFLAMVSTSCSSSTTVSFLCNNRDLQIYANDIYLGQELVTYTAPKGVSAVDIQCKKDGITIYTKNIYIKGNNKRLFEINVPSSMNYSSNSQIHSK